MFRDELAELMPVDVSCCPEFVYDGMVWLQLRLSDDTNGYYCAKNHKLIRESEFKKYLAAYAKGSKVKITYERYNGSTYEEFTVEVTLKGKDE